MAPTPEPHTPTEQRATTADVAATGEGRADGASTRDASAEAASTDHDTTDDKPANGVPAWLAGGMAVGGKDTNAQHRGFLRTVFRTA